MDLCASHYLTRPFEAYQRQLAVVCNPLRPNHRIREVALRILAVAICPLAYPLLGILYLIGRISSNAPLTPSIYDPRPTSIVGPRIGEILKPQIDALREGNENGWQEAAVRLIRHSRQDNPDRELERLKDVGVLNAHTEARIDFALSRVRIESGFLSSSARCRIKILYAQAIEIKKIYRHTHTVFLHGQASPWLPISHMVKELWRINRPELNLHQFKFLRAPCSTAEPGYIEQTHRLLSAINPFASSGIERYRDRWFQYITLSDNDNKVREELLSVDGYFYNYSRFESAMHFLSNNINILNSLNVVEEVAKKAISHFYPSLDQRKLSLYAKRITKTVSSQAFPCGNLFVICLPKEAPEKLHYRAHPFGRACACHPQEEDLEVLEKLQRDLLDESTKCNQPPLPTVPQYRLYLPGIGPDQEQRIFLLSPLTADNRKDIKSRIRSIVAEIHQQHVA